MRRYTLALGLLLLVRAALADPVGLAAYDITNLSLLRQGRMNLASSADPSGGNDDRGHFLRRDGGEAVLMEADGPGMITRIWSANPHGVLRIYFDGESSPRVDLPLDQLATPDGRTPTVEGWVSRAGGGVVCWYPMPFAKGCRVVVEGAEQLYYQINFWTYPASQPIKTFQPGEPQALGGMDWGAPSDKTVTIPPGGSAAVFDLSGPRTIRRLAVGVQPADYPLLRQQRLTLHWDGNAPASADAPLLDFFASGLGPAQLTSAAVAVGAWDLFTTDFPMPFAKSGRGVVHNSAPRPITLRVSTYSVPARREGDAYFHARYHAAETAAGQPHRLATLKGRGHFVGTAVTLLGNESLTFLEGDETITVDGKRTLQGTGTEDYFDGAWFFRRGTFSDVYAGATMLRCAKSQVAAYRWHVADCVPFATSLSAVLEHGPVNDAPGHRYRSVAYYYLAAPDGVPASTPPPPPPACAESGDAKIVEAETLTEAATAEGAELSVIDDAALPLPASGGKVLKVALGDGPATVTLPVTLPEAGYYTIVARLAGGGADQTPAVTLDGRKVPPPDTGASVGDPLLRLGDARIEAGEHRLVLALPAPGLARSLALDYLAFREVGKVKGALEAEALPHEVHGADAEAVLQTADAAGEVLATAYRSQDVVGGAVPEEAVWSGGAQVRFVPAEPGQTLDVRFPVDSTGDYGLAASFTRGPDMGAVAISLDGRELTDEPLDTRADAVTVGGRVPLGTHRLTEGEHTLTLRAVATDGRVSPVGLDFLLVEPAPRGHEAEHLLLRSLENAGEPVIKERFGAEPRWSGGAYLRVPAGAGARAAFSLYAPTSGTYGITLHPVVVPTGGVWTVALNGEVVGTADSGGAGESPGREPIWIRAQLRRGANELTLVAGDEGGDMALDFLEVVYIGGGWQLPVILVLVVLATVLAALWILRGRRAGALRRDESTPEAAEPGQAPS